ncbi:uroporphyrinogen-III synthase [Palleronia sediminis]|nr:uroporphyrinogen-III synthase [Palleronia sediminis]
MSRPRTPPPQRHLVLTRPADQSAEFATLARARGWDGAILFSPVTRIVPLDPGPLPEGELVFTSANGVRAAARLVPLAGRRAWAVGERTAQAARAVGMTCRVAGGDAKSLFALLRAEPGPFLHLHGRHVTGDLPGWLNDAGIPAQARVVYDQQALGLSDAARQALMTRPCVLPLMSLRTARLIAEDLGDRPVDTLLLAIAEGVLHNWPWPDRALVAGQPDIAGLLDRLAGMAGTTRPG